MPELPELEVICEVLQRRVVGQTLQAVKIIPPGGAIVVRDLSKLGFAAALSGATFAAVARRGKFLIFSFQNAGQPLYLAVNPKLSGRLQLAAPAEKLRAKTDLVISLAPGGAQLRYFDAKQMGQIYLVHDLAQIPEYAALGPEALQIPLAEFRERLKPFRGEIKGVLTRGEFVAGIGNAYADEILWEARLHPYRKSTQLSPEQIEVLYTAMRVTLLGAIEKIRAEMGEAIEREPRDFMSIHMKTGQPCPRCGTPISVVSANQRITNFCRTCQPGGLIKGM
ncbi:MAG: DNA-formamidopyrimidine glycosylase family protein [Anaerolineaceae bacterium]|nr:DNA-formamidopyrimidine glycosylase family protein [Anaerolineaceae bacterium]